MICCTLCGIFSCSCGPSDSCQQAPPKDSNPAPFETSLRIEIPPVGFSKDEEFARLAKEHFRKRFL